MGTYDDRWHDTVTSVPEGYDRLTARDAIAWLRGLPQHELEELRAYEEHGKGRATVIQAIDVRLDELEGPVVLPVRRSRTGRIDLASLPPAPPGEPFQEVDWPEVDAGPVPRRRWRRGTVALVGAAVATAATVGVVQPW